MRRAWLPLLAVLSCSTSSRETWRPDPRGGLEAREAPMLAGRGLPPLEQRLPADPLVVTPAERPGDYGGTWRMIVDGPGLAIFKIIGFYTPLVRWNEDASAIVPGLASSWETSADGKTLTLHLRHGVKWSDGVEFTSDDLQYWATIVNDDSLGEQKPFWSLVDGKPMTTEAPDPYTFVMHFAGPNYFVPNHLATGYVWCESYLLPKHYFLQFDPRVHPELKTFTLFDEKNHVERNPDRPTLAAWRLVSVDDAGNRATFERNPYFWMVDTKGRQLPYIDRVVTRVVDDSQLRILRILAGDVDAQFRLVDLAELQLLLEGQKRGHYRVLRWREGTGAQGAVMLNWSDPDPVLRGLIRDVRFRKALSYGIDRPKINEVAFDGQGIPQQATISRESWHFRGEKGKAVLDQWSEAAAEFDLDRGNALLDEMGLTKRDAEGYRLRPDGRRLSIVYDLPPKSHVQEDEARIVSAGWEKLGIEVTTRNFPLGTWSTRIDAGEFTVSNSMEAEMDLFTYPDWVFPTTPTAWHGKVGRWVQSRGKEGEAPTGPMKTLLDLYARVQREPDPEKAHDLVREAMRFHAEEGFFSLGTVADLPSLVIVRENFHNVPASPRVMAPWGISQPGASFPETFFFSDPGAEKSEAAP